MHSVAITSVGINKSLVELQRTVKGGKFVVLKYELGNVIVLVGDKLYSIKESSLSESSRLKIQPFKNR